MAAPKQPLDYASDQRAPQSRRTRRIRKEAFRLLIMAAIAASAAVIYFFTFRQNDDLQGMISGALVLLSAVFGLASLMRYLESLRGD